MDNTDWIDWNGGEMPVPYGTLVDVEYRDGKVAYGLRAGDSYAVRMAGCRDRTAVNWSDTAGPASIIRYRLHHANTAARRELEAAQAAYEAECRQWEPEGGEWWVNVDGSIETDESSPRSRQFGVERPIRQLAEQTRDAMRVHNRALAYVHEHAPEWDGGEPCIIAWNCACKQYEVYDQGFPLDAPIGTVTGPRHVMERLAEDLNSGRVKL